MAYIYPNKILINDNALLKEYLNNHNVKRIYYNGDEIFRRTAFSPYFEVDTTSITFAKTGGTESVEVLANAPYTASTEQSWIAINDNGSGFTVSVPDYSTGETERYGTISVVCDNGDFAVTSSISITQKVQNYTEVSYIMLQNIAWNKDYCITTPIVMANDYKVRLKYKYVGNGTDRLVGFTWEDKDIYGRSISDSADFRPFTYSNGSYDFQGARQSGLGIFVNNYEYDLTFGNYFVYDNKTSTYKYQGSAQNLTTEAYIRVDVGCAIKELIVYDGSDNVIFDGKAGYDDLGYIGLYDEVSDQMYYNPNLAMTYTE